MKNNIKEPRKDIITKEYRVQKSTPLLMFLLEHINQSRNNVKSLLSQKHVLVDGVLVTQFDYILQPKQIVKITKDAIKIQSKNEVKLPIVYEDEELIVINKPSGLLSIASDNENTQTAYRQVTDYVRQKDKKNRVYVVHRLDRDTSGLLMFSKNESIQKLLQDNWNELMVLRGYYAIVEGTFKEKEGTYRSWLKETSTHIMYSSNIKGQGLLSTTHYKVIKANRDYTLLEVHLDSGRKNQIRVHFFENNHGIIGDTKYGHPSNPLKRLGLHAYALKFKHPTNNKTYSFTAPMPPIFNNLFKG